jgi:hypothetical protein
MKSELNVNHVFLPSPDERRRSSWQMKLSVGQDMISIRPEARGLEGRGMMAGKPCDVRREKPRKAHPVKPLYYHCLPANFNPLMHILAAAGARCRVRSCISVFDAGGGGGSSIARALQAVRRGVELQDGVLTRHMRNGTAAGQLSGRSLAFQSITSLWLSAATRRYSPFSGSKTDPCCRHASKARKSSRAPCRNVK